MKQLTFQHIGKICTKCEIWKALDEFRKNKMGRYGRHSVCKICERAYQQDYYAENREMILTKGREHYHENIEQERIRSRIYRVKHPDQSRKRYLKNRQKILQQKRDYRAQNAEKIRAANRRQYVTNIEFYKARQREYYVAHKEKRRDYNCHYQANNPDVMRALKAKRKARKSKAGGSFTAKEFEALCNKYDNRCLCCGSNTKSLTADHIVPISKGGHSNIENIQPLCISCNSHKRDKIIDFRPDH